MHAATAVIAAIRCLHRLGGSGTISRMCPVGRAEQFCASAHRRNRADMQGLENQFWDFLQGLYQTAGWLGVVIMMTIESACIPLPSEIIMPLSGQYLVHDWLGVLEAGFFGALGCTIGSTIAYWVGALGGRPIIEKYGNYVLIRHHHLEVAD